MSGVAATIYLAQKMDDILEDVHRFLREHAAEVHPTRRGRVWEVVLTTVTKPGARIPAHIEVYALSERLLEHEDELRRLGISEDQAASCISLSTGLKDHHVLAAVQGTIIALAAELQAVAVRGPD